jgi:hypothetical protein
MGWISYCLRQVKYTPLEWTFYSLGFIMISGTVVYLYRLARKSLAKEIGEDAAGELPCRG